MFRAEKCKWNDFFWNKSSLLRAQNNRFSEMVQNTETPKIKKRKKHEASQKYFY